MTGTVHRAGEGAACTGLKPAGTDFEPAIPAAERAVELSQVKALLSEEVEHALHERLALDVRSAR
jgi:hypothetical protein